jgi:hypothetical protein
MDERESIANKVVTSVRREQDQGLRSLGRRAFWRESGILSVAMASFEGTLMISRSAGRLFSSWPFRESDNFQLVLLGRRLLAVEALLSVLFRRSSSCEVGRVFDGRAVV